MSRKILTENKSEKFLEETLSLGVDSGAKRPAECQYKFRDTRADIISSELSRGGLSGLAREHEYEKGLFSRARAKP